MSEFCPCGCGLKKLKRGVRSVGVATDEQKRKHWAWLKRGKFRERGKNIRRT